MTDANDDTEPVDWAKLFTPVPGALWTLPEPEPTRFEVAVDAIGAFTIAFISEVMGLGDAFGDSAVLCEHAIAAVRQWVYGPLLIAGAYADDELAYYGEDS